MTLSCLPNAYNSSFEKEKDYRSSCRKQKPPLRKVPVTSLLTWAARALQELYLRAHLGAQILQILQDRDLTKHKDVQEVLDIGQAEVSTLLHMHAFTFFSEGRLHALFLNKLDQKVTVKIAPRRRGEKSQEVVFA